MPKHFPYLNNELTLKHLRQRKNGRAAKGPGTSAKAPGPRAGSAGLTMTASERRFHGRTSDATRAESVRLQLQLPGA